MTEGFDTVSTHTSQSNFYNAGIQRLRLAAAAGSPLETTI
jgi:hypothetical protein